ncbi:hypothetical protein EV207_13920 [Scopulibacillus darangshiensis]|uniref:Phosphoglycolate phosphatase n=1 Tax=Scopulibacillus darangshiensis TaxID=442528 RepID=A0A4R2NKL7_9BACL|nr:Cof-type HAD-IIB family hydrolase [Scopulibacillus darangshiensis]TCP21878.1 hypothetical protein EV207_13920 [Scopulibacillus darangshiensis]
MPDYRLLALDLDGTTLTDKKKITRKTKKWIHRAVDAGVTVIFATGRGVQTAEQFWLELQLKAPMVLVNGAEIWEEPGQILKRHFLSGEDIERLHRLAVDEEAWFWGYSVESLTNKNKWTDEMFEREWLKFGMRHDDPASITKLRELVDSWGTLEVTRSAPINMEISAKGISKESGVRMICDHLGIQMGHVMAIGDNLNDLQLIRAAGLGIAMANADEELKQAADAVTASNNRNGVARAIKRYIF